MPSNPKRKGTSASQSFKPSEVDLGLNILRTLKRGGDVRASLTHLPAFNGLLAKFIRMQASIKEGKSGI